MQATSLISWMELELTLGERQATIHSALAELGMATNKKLSMHLGWPINSVTPRVQELRRLGLVSCVCGDNHLLNTIVCEGEIKDPIKRAKQWMIIPKRGGER